MLYINRYDKLLDPITNCKKVCKMLVPEEHRERVLRETHCVHFAEHLGIEISSSSSQNKYLIVFQDLFTRWMEVKPVRTVTTKNVVSAFRWEAPDIIISDNGKCFDRDLLEVLCRITKLPT